MTVTGWLIGVVIVIGLIVAVVGGVLIADAMAARRRGE